MTAAGGMHACSSNDKALNAAPAFAFRFRGSP